MTDDQSAMQTAAQTPAVAPHLRRPGDDIPNRPQLKVRPRTTANGDAAAQVDPLRRLKPPPTAPAPSAAEPEDVSEDEKAIREAKTLVMPPVVETARNPFATYGPPPPDEKAEEAELVALTGVKPERKYSTGFLLGVGLVVAVLVGGIWIAHMGNKVSNLEKRLNRIESGQVRTAALRQPGR